MDLAGVVRAIDLLDDDVGLPPARHGGAPADSTGPQETRERVARLRDSLVSSKYTDFRRAYGLPDSPKSQQLWTEYKRAAGVTPQPRKEMVALPSQRTGCKKSETQQVSLRPARLSSGADRVGPVCREERLAALLGRVNLPGPDVWR